MQYFKKKATASAPVYATEGAAAFDLSACLETNDKVRSYNGHNREMFYPVRLSQGRNAIQIPAGFRMAIPTGLAFDIPEGHVLDVNIRSGISLKVGLMLANGTGVIDSDYIEELFVLVTNITDTPIMIYDGERIAQAKLVKVERADLKETKVAFVPKGDRKGGLGSTGTAPVVVATEVVATEEAVVAPKPKGKGGRPRKNTVAQ